MTYSGHRMVDEGDNLSLIRLGWKYTYSLYFSSDDFSLIGIPERNNIISVVNIGDKIPIHSKPLITFKDITKMPHQIIISPK